ncbi:hypothetical protein C8N46_106251 [Kordia periserrulae]|uniref:Uncharacterized protein n=1 Tax=Kordia periserrulae TaxID=701523 RepID=A0A2T6BWZ9_9FLAO|nr:hypothetical protein C8N46_106251 [Kordia periserrulae]
MRQERQTRRFKIFTENNTQKIQSWKHNIYIENTFRNPDD